MKILVCDDKLSQGKKTSHAIKSRGDVTILAGAKLAEALRSFFRCISGALDGASIPDHVLVPKDFSGYDLVIVDNNLTGLELDGARLTAETIIGYLRAFTDIPYIVSLNKNLHVDFDLRFLFGDSQSLADIALNARHLSNNCLWGADAVTGFAPWYWPRLPDARARREKQIGFLAENLERSVWAALSFPPEADEYLSLRAKAALASSENQGIRDTTFEAFFETSRALLPAEKDKLVAAKGAGLARTAIERIVAYEVDRWLRRDVLGTQDVLIDLPHLVAQMPFLLGDCADQLDSWNQLVRAEREPFGLDGALFRKHVRTAQFVESIWAPTPCFWWPSLRSDEGLTKLFFEAKGDWPDAVFCEDVSRFVPVPGKGPWGPPTEFEAEIAGSWARRYVVEEGDYLYSPRSRIVGSAK